MQWPALSPDGKRVVFTALNHVWIMDVPSGKPERLTRPLADAEKSGEFMPTWSPDGKYVAFVTWTKDGGHLYRVVATPGSAPERLSRYAAYYAEPVYTPDGSKIVYLTGTRDDQLYADLKYIEGGDPDVFPESGVPGEIDGAPAKSQLHTQSPTGLGSAMKKRLPPRYESPGKPWKIRPPITAISLNFLVAISTEFTLFCISAIRSSVVNNSCTFVSSTGIGLSLRSSKP